MKAQKIRDLDGTEIQRQLSEMGEQLFRIRFQLNMGQAEGIKKYRTLRKDRARMLSILREREIDPAKAQAAAEAAKAKAAPAKRSRKSKKEE
jgi:large subunit ribosomal protein L29